MPVFLAPTEQGFSLSFLLKIKRTIFSPLFIFAELPSLLSFVWISKQKNKSLFWEVNHHLVRRSQWCSLVFHQVEKNLISGTFHRAYILSDRRKLKKNKNNTSLYNPRGSSETGDRIGKLWLFPSDWTHRIPQHASCKANTFRLKASKKCFNLIIKFSISHPWRHTWNALIIIRVHSL